MAVYGEYLYIATSGGLLVIDPGVSTGQRFTNLDGFSTVDLTDLTNDDDGLVWVTGDGRLIQLDEFNVTAFPLVDNDGNRLRLLSVEDADEDLWIGYEAGLILWDKTFDGGQIQEVYDMFGELNDAPSVNDITLSADSIWIATSAGLAAAARSDTRALLNPANWKGYERGEYAELTSDTINTVARFSGTVYLGTSDGLFRLDTELDSLVRMPFAVDSHVYHLAAESDSLWVYSEAGLGVVVGTTVNAVATDGVSGGVRTGTRFGNMRWVGADDGLCYRRTGAYEAYPYVGLPDNEVADVAIRSDGVLAALFMYDGPHLFQSGQWVHQAVDNGSYGVSMAAGPDGRLYVGTFGAGMSVIGDGITKYTTGNSTLQEADPTGSGYVVCNDVAVSSSYVFGVNFEPRDGTRLAVGALSDLDNLSNWTSLGVADGITGEQMVSVDFKDSAVALGSGLSGAYYYYYGSNFFNKSDDSVANYTLNNDNWRYRILSDVVRVVRFSPDGELWVGTNYGISRFDRSLDMFVEVTLPSGFGPDITDIEFDSRGDAWVGAKNGLARIDSKSGQVGVYTTANSGLVNNRVNRITFDDASANVYVSTNSGISIIQSIFGVPTSALDDVVAFPNPFVINSSDDRVGFNYAGNATIRIFTVAGELVAETGDLTWDGRNSSGTPVSSGVYLFVLTDSEGNSGSGKLLLVRD